MGAVIKPVTNPPYRFTLQYGYDAGSGALVSVQDANTGFAYWQADTGSGVAPVDGFGHLLAYTDGNNVSTALVYDQATAAVNVISTGIGQSTAVQALTYTWDGFGNLKSRQWLAYPTPTTQVNPVETFSYDVLNRFSNATLSGSTVTQNPVNYSYNVLGNITTKSDVGTYTYSRANAGPHAVTAVTGLGSYAYDLNGNMTSRAGTNVQWNSLNMPTCTDSTSPTGICNSTSTALTNNWSKFAYAPDKHRYVQTAYVQGVSENTTYVGTLEMVNNAANGNVENHHRISAYGRDVVSVDLNSDGTGGTSYLHADHLGSVDAATKWNGAQIGTFGYDAFGLRRDPVTGNKPQPWSETAADRDRTHRGFTNHEMLDNVTLIHMNGRVYDPNLGRFLSVDPVFQFPNNGQSINAYSYVLNNPLSLTDPTGYDTDVNPGSDCTTLGNCAPSPATNDKQEPKTVHTSTTVTGSHIVSSATATQKADGSWAINQGGPSVGLTTSGATGNGSTGLQGSTDAQNKPSTASDISSPGNIAKSGVSDVSDKVDVNPWFKKNIKVNKAGTELTADIPVMKGPGVSDDDLKKSESEITTELDKTYQQAGKPDLKINIRFHTATKDGDDVLHFLTCPPNVCHLLPNGSRIEGDADHPGNWMRLDYVRMSPGTPAHEFLHTLGLHHQDDGTGSIMSYDQHRQALYTDAQRLINAYRP